MYWLYFRGSESKSIKKGLNFVKEDEFWALLWLKAEDAILIEENEDILVGYDDKCFIGGM